MRRIISRLLATTLVITGVLSSDPGSIDILASENEASIITPNLGDITQEEYASDDFNYYDDIEYVEVEPLEIPETEPGSIEHEVSSYSLSARSGLMEQRSLNNDNTDPNYAVSISNNNTYYGTISSNNEFRWYTFTASALSKVTVYMEMSEELDADLYLFVYNTEDSSLELYDGSATEGTAGYEYLATVAEEGTYYLAISGYDSSGNFAFLFYQSTADAANEVNDSSDTATEIDFGTVSGVIDSIYDVDYYKITLTNPAIIKYSISSTNEYGFQYAGSDGTGAGLSIFDSSNAFVKANAGTYYFAVYPTDTSGYSASQTYTLTFKKIGEISSNSSVHIAGISESTGIVYQSNSSGTVGYVNGNLIDISYSYVANLSNEAGLQTYSIILNPAEATLVMYADSYKPQVAYYLGSTKPAINVSNRYVLKLTYYGSSNLYKIHCYGSGAYSGNTFNQDMTFATVIIDPESGRLIDIDYYNYYYDFNPTGNNSITLLNNSSLILY